MSSKKPNSFIFAAVMCLVCSFLLTFAAVSLKDLQVANKQLDQQKNILKALQLIEEGQKYPKAEITTLYTTKVQERWMTSAGKIVKDEKSEALPLYVVGSGRTIDRYAIPFKAYGLWSWVYGYVAFDGDGNTIIGMTVYEHGETPGLGGEVEKEWFRDQFKGKKIVSRDRRFVSIGVVKGKVSDKIAMKDRKHYVDGISGATITSKGMEKYLKLTIEQYEPFASKLR